MIREVKGKICAHGLEKICSEECFAYIQAKSYHNPKYWGYCKNDLSIHEAFDLSNMLNSDEKVIIEEIDGKPQIKKVCKYEN